MSDIDADDRDDLGEMAGIGERPLLDFLPPPDQLVRREDTVKVTLALSRANVDFFRNEAKRQGVPYQRMIRALVGSMSKLVVILNAILRTDIPRRPTESAA